MSHASQVLLAATLDVRWGDMDAFNHVNNAVYATYVEEARLRWMDTVKGEWNTSDCAPVIAAQSINYRAPLTWPGQIVVELMLERVGNSSLTMGFRIISSESPHRFYADGSTVMVWYDPRTGKSTPLPECVRRAAQAGRE